MKKKTVYTISMEDQEYEDMEDKENKDNTTINGRLYNEADRCPICLNCLLEQEVGFPESCNHVFCMACILKWSETLASCPIDRKPFQAVFKFSALEGCVKVQVKTWRETKNKKNENSFKKQLSCHENSRSCMRKKVLRMDLLSTKLCDLKMLYSDPKAFRRERRMTMQGWRDEKGEQFKCNEMGGTKNTTIRINKSQRSNHCTSPCFQNFFSSMFSSDSHTGESSLTHRSYCTEYLEASEISALIRQKRQELELSWFPDAIPGIGRISFIPWNIETEVLPLISSVLPRTIFPTNTISLENYETSYKEYALAHTQGGEEKKQTSGTSNSRGSRRKPAATPTRRSTRNLRAETVSQPQGSLISSNSGCDSSDNNPSASVPYSTESEKQAKQAPKRKSVRRGRKPPLLKKKLRSSVPPPEKSSSESVDEETPETPESDIPPVLEIECQSNVESNNTSNVQADVENEPPNGLETCSGQIEESESQAECQDIQEKVEFSFSESSTQDTSVLVEEDKIQNVKNIAAEGNVLILESESSKSTFEKGGVTLENQEQVSEQPESVVIADMSTESEVIAEIGTESEVIAEIGTESDVIADKGTESDVIADTGTESDVIADTGTESDVIADTGTESNVIDTGTESNVIADTGTESIADTCTESEVKADTGADPPSNDSLRCSELEIEVHPHVPSLSELSESDLSENKGSLINEENVIGSPVVELTDHKDSIVKTEQFVDSPRLESSEDGIIQTVDAVSLENRKIKLLGHVETEDVEKIATCETSANENVEKIQDSESNLLKNNIKSDKCLEDKTEPLVEHPKSSELPNTHIEQIQNQFSEDNNEMIPMECDSFCNDQSESEIEQSVNADAKPLSENSVEHISQNSAQFSDLAGEKVGTESQPSDCSVDKAKRPRTRKSRFHSPSTTWSPNKDSAQEQKRSQSPSPKRETGRENRKSRSPSPKKESARGRRKSRSQSPKKDVSRERKSSQTQSPKRDSTREGKRSDSLSPKKDTSRENRRSQSRVKDSSPREKSRSRSRERENDRDGQRRDRDRERRTRRWSRSRSRSRSPSRSRSKNKSSLFGRNDRDNYSRWKERWTNDGWRCPRGNDRYRKNDPEKQNENTRKEKIDTDISSETDGPNSEDKYRNNCPSWVTEKINSGPDPRTRNPEKLKDSHWEENRNENSGNSWNKNFNSSWNSNRGRGNRGRGSYRGGFAYTDQNENRWQNRKPLSGNSNSSGNEPFKFVEQQPYKRKNEQEFSFDTPADRSGWTSASSWAVRKTLPADVQNYYSRRGRNSSGPQSGWMRQDEETTEQDSNIKDQTSQQGDGSQLPINMMQPQMNVMQQPMNVQHQPMNIFPYPMGVHAPLMNIQRNPYNIHPQLPMHLHTGVPLMQVSAPPNISQGLPPPPPPPPPSQQVNYIASQPDGKQLQGIPSASHVSNNMSAPVLPAPAAASGNMGTVQGPSSGNTSSSSHSKASNAAVKLAESKVSVTVEASADSSKTDKKLQIQEKAAQEVKLAIKPFYQNKDITKDEYKEIVRKAVDKVCHSKSGEVNSTKVANLVKAYVDKYKYSRKGSQKKTLEETVSAEKNIG